MSDTKHTPYIPSEISITNFGSDESGHHYKVQIGTIERTFAYAWCPTGCDIRKDQTHLVANKIVKAWNCYDDMLEALEIAMHSLTYGVEGINRDDKDDLETIRAVIAIAKGE